VPDSRGFAGAFTGVAGGALILAGGTNVAGDRWRNPRKEWHDAIWVLECQDGAWKKVGRLPRPCGYGVSVSVDGGLICIGGGDASTHHAEVFRLDWYGDSIWRTPLPPLPSPCAFGCGALAGRVVYVAGGLTNPWDTTALRTFWALDLDATDAGWRALDPWPGKERMLAAAGVDGATFYLFSGAALSPGREYLRDAYRYLPTTGWERIADLPRPAVAAPSPTPGLLVVSGDHGRYVDFEPPEAHPGFSKQVLSYAAKFDRWSVVGEAPFSRVNVAVVSWHGRWVFANGEVRPRERSVEVWTMQ